MKDFKMIKRIIAAIALAASLSTNALAGQKIVIWDSITVVSTASGIDSSTFKLVDAAVAGALAAAGTVASAGAGTAAAVGIATTVVSTGAAGNALKAIDGALSVQDDLFLMANGQKIWPTGKWHGVKPGDHYQVHGLLGQIHAAWPLFPNKPVHIGAFEYDSGSASDLLGIVTIDDTWALGTHLVRASNEEEGSVYIFGITVAEQ